ncbi:hypothetical protein JOC75_000594 [Metabacillus crassostreae]|uniref:hypothetical protein n=1 Tax=Metabacillus crassostreae TaxID=929098 RepID=UPI0019590E24|nr:hypothetical protein [Metabacillus crassostreae]MBM7602624.1 hypothetical protein [Metabacillus crassostreae]
MSLQNQLIIEWTIIIHYDDVSFAERLEHLIKAQTEQLKEGEALEIHQIVYVGEIKEKEKTYLIILNIVPEK